MSILSILTLGIVENVVSSMCRGRDLSLMPRVCSQISDLLEFLRARSHQRSQISHSDSRKPQPASGLTINGKVYIRMVTPLI